jgi:aminoglycoside phosphotransferase (APT) family kinase protein
LDVEAIKRFIWRRVEELGDQVSLGRTVDGLTRLSGGASQETWRFVVYDERGVGDTRILRGSTHGNPQSEQAIGLLAEADVLDCARAAGVPVPEVIYRCVPDDNLGEAYVMAFINGETVARKILRDTAYAKARECLATQVGAALAAIHAIPLSGPITSLPKSDGLDQLARYEEIYRGFKVNRPVLELAIQWLRQAAPAPIATTLVHGDFRNGNLIVSPAGLAAVLDWELCHLGDPREDLGWICVNSWRFGVREKAVGGFGDLDDLLLAYQRAAGATFAKSDIKWFQALGSFKWAIMCLIMYEAYKSGADPSIERAMIGRRTSEAEIDLLNLIEGRPYA